MASKDSQHMKARGHERRSWEDGVDAGIRSGRLTAEDFSDASDGGVHVGGKVTKITVVAGKMVSAGRQDRLTAQHEQVAAEMAARAAAAKAEAKNGQGNAGNSAVSAAGKDSSGVKMEL